LAGGFIRVMDGKQGARSYCLSQRSIDFFIKRSAPQTTNKKEDKKK